MPETRRPTALSPQVGLLTNHQLWSAVPIDTVGAEGYGVCACETTFLHNQFWTIVRKRWVEVEGVHIIKSLVPENMPETYHALCTACGREHGWWNES